MFFVGLGLVLLVLKTMQIGWVASLSWPWVLAPFALAMAWWAWADATGYTKRRVMEREDRRKRDRILANRANLGTIQPRDKRR